MADSFEITGEIESGERQFMRSFKPMESNIGGGWVNCEL